MIDGADFLKWLNIFNVKTGASGNGNVSNFGTSTNNAIPRFVGTVGTTIQDSLVTIDNNGSVSLPGTLNLISTTNTGLGAINQNSLPLLNTYNNNLFLGQSAGNFTLNLVSQRNIGIGLSALAGLTTGTDNVVFAYQSGALISSGAQNAIFAAQTFITTGSYNTIIGVNSGESYVGNESSNILIGNIGIVGESNICRIGTTGSGTQQITDMYLAGNAIHASALFKNTKQFLGEPTTFVTTMSQTGIMATITGLTSAFYGAYVIPAIGLAFTVIGYAGTTTVPTNVSQTITGGTSCTVYYFPNGSFFDIDIASNGGLITLFSNIQYLQFGATLQNFVNVANGCAQSFSSTNSLLTAPANSSNQTASQSGTTVTGVGTSWDSSYVGHMIRFSTGQTAWITSVLTTTSMTVTPSQTVLSCDFDVPGKTTANEATSMDSLGNFGSSNIYANASLHARGSVFNNITEVVATPYTSAVTDYYIGVNVASAATVNIPTASGSGRILIIADESLAAATNNITITPASGNIEGVASIKIQTNGGSYMIIDRSANNWKVI